MSDSLSIVITVIVLVIIIILFPLYNVFERQDDMSYNVALKETTSFVDSVVNSGYIDQAMYDAYVGAVAQTGNSYDIQLEVHKRIFTKDPNNPGKEEYIEQYIIDYNKNIFDFDSTGKKVLKNKLYILNLGDQIYVKLKNAAPTLAGSLFRGVMPNPDKTIAVNYGGIVKNCTWKESEISNLIIGNINVDIKVVGNLNNQIHYTGEYPTFYLNLIEDRTVKFKVTILNLDAAEISKVKEILEGNVTFEGLNIGNIKPQVNKNSDTEWEMIFKLDKGVDEYLAGSISKTAYVHVPGQILQGKLAQNEETVSKNILIHRDSTIVKDAVIYGPYDVAGKSVSGNIKNGSDLYFYANFINPSSLVNIDVFKNTYLKLVDGTKYTSNITVTDESMTGSTNKTYKIFMQNVHAVNYTSLPLANQKIQVAAGAYIKNGKTSVLDSSTFNIEKPYEQKFTYTGSVQTFIAPSSGNYLIELYGASGGGNPSKAYGSSAGFGGYTRGEKYLNAGEKLYIFVGGKGVAATAIQGTGGGYNGGGHGGAYLQYSGFGGGGATDVRTVYSELWNNAASLASRIIVAGGGGGADDNDGATADVPTNNGSGGDGGGLSGKDAMINGSYSFGTAGTQYSGNIGLGESVSNPDSLDIVADSGGAGGGYRGGKVTNNHNGGGGGGSSYYGGVSNASTISGVNGPSGLHLGDGFAIISLL